MGSLAKSVGLLDEKFAGQLKVLVKTPHLTKNSKLKWDAANQFQLLQNKFFATGKVIGEIKTGPRFSVFCYRKRIRFLTNNPGLPFCRDLGVLTVVGPFDWIGFLEGTILPAMVTGTRVNRSHGGFYDSTFPLGFLFAGITAPVWYHCRVMAQP